MIEAQQVVSPLAAMKQALDALGPNAPECCGCRAEWQIAIESLRQVIQEFESQEPDYWLGYGLQAHTEKPFENATALYTHPPQRKPLTDGDFLDWYDSAIWGNEDFKQCCQIAFEAGWQFAHGIKE